MSTFAAVQLPPGYHVEPGEGELRLVDPDGEAVFTSSAVNTLLQFEEQAWRHAWEHIEREIRQELQEHQNGSRTVPQLRRMRQYVSLMEAVAEGLPGADGVSSREARRPVIIPWPARPLAGAGATVVLAAAALLIFLLVPADRPIPPAADFAPQGPEAAATAPAQPPAALREGSPLAPVAKRSAGPQISKQPIPARKPLAAKQARTRAGYATFFGRFPNLRTAQAHAQRVRSKGYLATVVRRERSFLVIGRIYQSRTQAERMARILTEIALPATVQPLGL